jgi:transposase
MKRIAQLEAQLASLTALVEKLQQELAERDARIAELEARLGADSQNSHNSSSTDSPRSGAGKNRRGRRRRKASGRAQGGQSGHKGKTRQMLPADEVDRIEECRPENCTGCGLNLADTEMEASPERHQVSEIPPIRPVVTEYQLCAVNCPGCGKRNKASLPEGVTWSAFGPRVHALTAMLSGVYRIPRRPVQQMLSDYFGLTVSLGSIVNMQYRASQAMAPAVDEAIQAMRDSSQPTNMDETGWRQAGERRWLWVALTEMLVIFCIRKSRGGKVVIEMVGEQAGERVVIVDRWSGYSKIPLERKQFCWAHLLRDFQKMAEAPDIEAARIGRWLLCGAALLFQWWRRFCAEEITRAQLQIWVMVLRKRMRLLFKFGTHCAHRKTAGTCRSLLKSEAALWTFVRVEGVEPTNNAAERAIRKAVIWRRISQGTQSDLGARFVERILSVAATLQRQKRGVFDFLQAAMHARFTRLSAPSLLAAGMGT